MAIYHFSVQVISRGKGRNAVAAAAYRSGEKIKDEQTNKVNDYRKKQVDEKFILAPDNSPDWVTDRSKLWNEVEKKETRKNSRLAREINVALPVELSNEKQTELIQSFVYSNFIDKGMVADVCIHRDNPSNPHAHIMLTTREINETGFTTKNRNWDKKELVTKWRESWSDLTNTYLELEGSSKRIDHRSYKEQGIDKTPTIHEGHKVTALKRKGKITNLAKQNEQIKQQNEIKQAQKEIAVASDLTERPNLNDTTQPIPKPTPTPKNRKISQNKKNNAQEKVNIIHQIGDILPELHLLEQQQKSYTHQKQKIEMLLNEPLTLQKEMSKIVEENMKLKPSNLIEKIKLYFDKDTKKEISKNTQKIEKLQERNLLIQQESPKLKKDLKIINQKLLNINSKIDEKNKTINTLKQQKKEIDLQQYNSKTKYFER